MSLIDRTKALLDRRPLRFAITLCATQLARRQNKGVSRIFNDSGIWMHETSRGFFAYHQPFIRLHMAQMEESAYRNFGWGYSPRSGDVVIDVGAGVGEEALTFSRALGKQGRLICIEAHPRTYRCLQKLVHYNHLENTTAVHAAVTEKASGNVLIGDSDAYLSNRLHSRKGIPVPATTIDAIHHKLSLGRVHFLKMNIEGAERYAIRGMSQTMLQTEVLCISCHDFLADKCKDDSLRTRILVEEFLQDSGFNISPRPGLGLAPYLRDQVWAFNRRLIGAKAAG